MPDELLASVAARLQLPADALAELHQLLLTPPSTELCGYARAHAQGLAEHCTPVPTFS